MKKALILLATLLSLVPMVQAASAVHIKELYARDGDSCYRMGDYAGAIDIYQSVLASGFDSPELYYNLAGAYYRQGDITHAILNYERALRLKPSMHDARENLELARSKTVDRIEQLPQLYVVRMFNNLCSNVTPRAWRTIWLLLLALLVAAIVVVIIGSRLKLRRWGLGTAVAMGVLLTVATIFLTTSTTRYNNHADAIVMQQSLTVKSSPEHQSADKLILHEGTRVHITESLSGWDKITIADGTTGWCPAETIERI